MQRSKRGAISRIYMEQKPAPLYDSINPFSNEKAPESEH